MADRQQHELQRLRRVYRARRARGVEDRYAPYERSNLFRLQRLERDLARALRGAGLLPLRNVRALDLGCGGGWWLRQMLRWGAHPTLLAGVDALREAAAATASIHPGIACVQAGGDALPFAAGTFDLVSQFTVFSSILDAGVRRRAAAELRRVLRPGGLILWYDFTLNPFNPDTHPIGRRELAALFPGCRIEARRVTLAPPLARLLAPRAWQIAELLEGLPLLRTHLLAVIRDDRRH